jgi:catechol 2,3-dioxygenase-like lactoylglutathione lyase family enzyme
MTIDRTAEWAELRRTHLQPAATRPDSIARGVHHVAFLCSDVDRTIRFYQGVLGFPLVELFENRDYPGSTHFFFDIGHGNLLAFFDMPGLDLGPYREVLGGLHHLAISVDRSQFDAARDRLVDAGVALHLVDGVDESIYFMDPDGTRLELLAAPLHEMSGRSLVD